MSDLQKSTLDSFSSSGSKYQFQSLPKLAAHLKTDLSRLPVSLRIVLESVLRHCDGLKATPRDVENLARWNAKKPAPEEIPFTVARIVLQDFTGVPLLVDLAAMRDAVTRLKRDPKLIEPLVPVDLVVDHSVQVDVNGTKQAFLLNMQYEFKRNRERYEFLKWGQQAFETFGVVPPGIGIVHQVNLEYLARGVFTQKQPDGSLLAYPDSLVGTDSHTTMINGLGIVGWGVGGIEAEAGMLGQPLTFLTPEVVGFHLTGELPPAATATDLALTVTQLLRKHKVVGKFVEFFGPGAARLTLPDRATIANMAPEYGATMGYFPVDAESLSYLRGTGRTEEQVKLVEDYFRAQGLFGIAEKKDALDFSSVVELDLATVKPSVAGPKRPQDRIELPALKSAFDSLLTKSVADGGYGKNSGDLAKTAPVSLSTDEQEMISDRPTPDVVPENSKSKIQNQKSSTIRNGSVVIAAITSCTNTSNPSVMLAAGLLAKKAVERGLTVDPTVKASLAPGSRVVSDYLTATGLQPFLDQLGFNLVGYGCTTCIGNSGPLPAPVEKAVTEHDLVAASVLSGNRNFEARVHPSVKANFLMSPPLVVAFALAGRVDLDLSKDPLGLGKDGKAVYLRDLWPTREEIGKAMQSALKPEVFRKLYRDFSEQNPAWNEIPSKPGLTYAWDRKSTYIQEPPFFENFSLQASPVAGIQNARCLGVFGDSVTTDHISPAGNIKKTSPAGSFLIAEGVPPEDFNSYGARRGNDRVMTRGTFANVRIKNLMLPGVEGGLTLDLLDSKRPQISIYDAAQKYRQAGVPLIILAGKEYGTGSSRDWAAKGTRLLGVRAVIAESFERIHRSNLVGMGVLPCTFADGVNAQTLKLDGTETYSLEGLSSPPKPRETLILVVKRSDGKTEKVPVTSRLDTPIEVECYLHGGILPFVLRQ
ncbi:MAG: aconitate hydratase AcnA, partial [Verrucomicrobia bacterium]|nr:aconitate hydratase AcnA [Verrucomicrobiota bacterium]